ncbi:MAG: hypothetical protein IJR94_03540, partial [Synergistaceae bacterium]|nr:hypothetical protein [Synergistaceae bacterium]
MPARINKFLCRIEGELFQARFFLCRIFKTNRGKNFHMKENFLERIYFGIGAAAMGLLACLVIFTV